MSSSGGFVLLSQKVKDHIREINKEHETMEKYKNL